MTFCKTAHITIDLTIELCCYICMDNESNSKFQFRLPNELAEDFKLACIQLGVKPSEKLRDLMTFFF